MKTFKNVFFAFFFLVVAFVVSAVTFGEFHSALSVIIGYGAGVSFAKLHSDGFFDRLF